MSEFVFIERWRYLLGLGLGSGLGLKIEKKLKRGRERFIFSNGESDMQQRSDFLLSLTSLISTLLSISSPWRF